MTTWLIEALQRTKEGMTGGEIALWFCRNQSRPYNKTLSDMMPEANAGCTRERVRLYRLTRIRPLGFHHGLLGG